MAVLLLPSRGAVRPTTTPHLNQGHWYANQLVEWVPLLDQTYLRPAWFQPLRYGYGATTLNATGGPFTTGASEIVGPCMENPAAVTGISHTGTNYVQPAAGSVAIWCRLRNATPTEVAKTGPPISFHTGGGATTHYPYTDGVGYIGILSQTRFTITLASNVNRAQWHHFAVTNTGATNGWKFYQNGRLVYTGTSANTHNEYRWYIGSSFDGWIADAGFWHRALTEHEVYQLWHPATRWGHYWVPSRRVYLDLGAAAGVTISPGAGAVALAGATPAAHIEMYRAPTTGAVALSGYAPAASQGVYRLTDTGTLTFGGHTPSLSEGVYRRPDAGALTLTGQTPGAAIGYVLTPGTGTLTYDGLAPTSVLALTFRPDPGTLTWLGLAPDVSVLQQGQIVPPAGVLTLTGLNPSVRLDLVVQPAAGTLTLSGLAPARLVDVRREVPTGTLTLTGHVPGTTLAGGVIVSPATGTVTLTGLSPSLLRSFLAHPEAGTLVLTGFAPSVSATSPVSFTMHVDVAGRDFRSPKVSEEYAAWGPEIINPGAS